MNSNLLFDFSTDKENKCIRVRREFAADRALVWSAWTTPEILDQWWAPKPYKTQTKSMDFRPGGTWLYAMIAPEGQAHWCRNDYKEINHQDSFSGMDAFCDEEGNINTEFPRMEWKNTFSDHGDDATYVDVTIQFDKPEDLEKIIEMGFKEGFTMALGNLDEYLETKKQ